jgi:hypothetical protein
MDRINRLASILAHRKSSRRTAIGGGKLDPEFYDLMGPGGSDPGGEELAGAMERLVSELLDKGMSPEHILEVLIELYNADEDVVIEAIKSAMQKRGMTNGRGSSRHRTAQPLDEDEYRPHKQIKPSRTDVDPTAKIYRDTDDLREEADEDEDMDDERGDKSVLLFGGDDDDDGLDYADEDVGKETLRKSRLKLLAGMIWAELGEPDAVVEESAPNELSVRVQDLSWKVSVDDDGKVQISGFDSGAEQFVGNIPDEDAEAQIVKISDHIHQLIAEDIDEKSTPAEPPVHFGPEETGVEDMEMGGEEEAPPVAPGGDQGAVAGEQAVPPDMGAPAAGGEMPFGVEAMPAPAPAPGGMPPAGGALPAPAPGGYPPAPGGPPAPFPAASRRRQTKLPPQVSRVATARLENVSNELEGIGESLGSEGEEVFGDLAERVRSVVDWIS